MSNLQLGTIPELPQRKCIVEIAPIIWLKEGVVALWVGGSLARGAGDEFSDVDFRVAVTPQHLSDWKMPDFDTIFTSAPVVGQTFLPFGDNSFLHHLVLSNGEIFDFYVQSIEKTPTLEPLLILGCRDEQFGRLLAERNEIPPITMQAARKEVVRQLLVDFWISTHKHRKVLHRDLALTTPIGINGERSTLLRLWYIKFTGEDCGDLRQQTIHSFAKVARTLEQAMGAQASTVLGAPTRDRTELYQTIERNREEIAHLGRWLAQKYEFEYPVTLEKLVLECWTDFVRDQ